MDDTMSDDDNRADRANIRIRPLRYRIRCVDDACMIIEGFDLDSPGISVTTKGVNILHGAGPGVAICDVGDSLTISDAGDDDQPGLVLQSFLHHAELFGRRAGPAGREA